MSKVNLNKKSKRYLEIGVSCKTQKEHLIMLTLITYIQHYYNAKFKEDKIISLRELTEVAIKDLEERYKSFYPFREK